MVVGEEGAGNGQDGVSAFSFPSSYFSPHAFGSLLFFRTCIATQFILRDNYTAMPAAGALSRHCTMIASIIVRVRVFLQSLAVPTTSQIRHSGNTSAWLELVPIACKCDYILFLSPSPRDSTMPHLRSLQTPR